MVGRARLLLPVERAGSPRGRRDGESAVDRDAVEIEPQAHLLQKAAGGDDLVEHLVAVRKDLAARRGADEERADVLRGEELPGGVVEEDVAAGVGRRLPLGL